MVSSKLAQKILPILKKRGVKRASFFGSLVKNKFRKTSDVDILVEVNSKMDLLDFIGLKIEIENILKKKVDLVEFSTIKPLLRQEILSSQLPIL